MSESTTRLARAYAGKYMADSGPLPATPATIAEVCAACARRPREPELSKAVELVNTWSEHQGRWS
jgi:hypothetical protein